MLKTDEMRQVPRGEMLLFKAKLQNFFQVLLQFIKRGGLRMRPGNARNDTDIEFGIGIPFNIRGECLHKGDYT